MKTTRSRRGTPEGAFAHDILPVLSAGRHRSPRSGACFMEFASYLAGERWSDHPACTHAALAHLARAVNDLTTNEGRGRLAPLIPSVIGLTSDDPRLELLLAVNAVAAALPEAPLDRQHALAVGGLVCLDALERRGGSASGAVETAFRAALGEAPEAHLWAERFLEHNARWRRAEVTSRQTHATIAMSVDGVRSACTPYPDDRLRALLASSIRLTREFVSEERAAAVPGAPAPATASVVTPDPNRPRNLTRA
ncbi:hypothetical protein [Herbiconiux sp. YIM B11900]|uniref:hypothetical protein n=1 Tax=Herbiconiux sp. YIM B11900 TaxID=3404131 RepID=UPI003F83B332